jgi:V/A-type H+-transporting ATPase subunit E
MGLDQVKHEILQDAEEEADRIVEEAEQQAEEIVDEAEEKAEQLKEEAQQEAEEKAEALRRQELASANMEAQRKKLSAKQGVIEDAFERLEERVRDMDTEKKLDLLTDVIEDIKDEITIGRVETSEDLVSELEDRVDAEVVATDIEGVIIENEDGSMRYDYSFATMLQNVRKNGRKAAASKLFDEQ